jgi:hypothetical protein
MADVEEARRVLEAERLAVLDELAQAAEERQAEHERHRVELAALSDRTRELFARGKAAGASVIEMAEAFGMTRQHAHRLLARPSVSPSGSRSPSVPPSGSRSPSVSPSPSPSPSPKQRAQPKRDERSGG